MKGRHAIFYIAHGDKVVLLKDGAFTSPSNCMMREFGAVFCIPKLFDTARAARLYLATHFPKSRWHITGIYTGPLKPWEREGSIAKVAFDLGYVAAA